MNAATRWTRLGALIVMALAGCTQPPPVDEEQPITQERPAPVADEQLAAIDLPHVMRSLREVRDINATFKEQAEQINTEFSARYNLLDDLRQVRDAFRPDHENWYKKNRELLAETIKLRVWQEEATEDLRATHVLRMQLVYERLLDTVAALARERGFLAVFQTEFAPRGQFVAPTAREQVEERPYWNDFESSWLGLLVYLDKYTTLAWSDPADQPLPDDVLRHRALYVAPRINLTDAVINRMNEDYAARLKQDEKE